MRPEDNVQDTIPVFRVGLRVVVLDVSFTLRAILLDLTHYSLKGRVKTKQNSARGFECGCDFSLETVQLINVSFPLTDTFIHQARLGAVLTPAPPQGIDTELLYLIHQY